MIHIYLKQARFIFILALLFMAIKSEAQSPDCSRCYDDAEFVTTFYGGTQDSCIQMECGIPVNQHLYLLSIVGFGIAIAGYKIKGNFFFKNTNSGKIKLKNDLC